MRSSCSQQSATGRWERRLNCVLILLCGLGTWEPTASSWSARRNHDGIAEEEWAGQMQENSKRLLNPLYAVFTVTKESMYLRHRSTQALLPGFSSCGCETMKVQSSKLSKETQQGLRSWLMLSFSQITDLDPLQNGSSTLHHTDRNASGDRPYVNNTPYVITLRLDIQFLNNSQIQLSQQQATQDALSAGVTLTIPFWLLRHKGRVSSSLLTSPSEWSHTIQEIPSNWQNKRWPEITPRRRVGCSYGLSDKLGFEWCSASQRQAPRGTESRGYLLQADKLRKDHTPEKPKGMQTSQLGVWTVFLKMCFRFTSHNGLSNLSSLWQNLTSIWHQEPDILNNKRSHLRRPF